MTKYVMAAFRIDEEKSLVYIKRKTLESFLPHIKKTIEFYDPDYISIRIIRDSAPKVIKNE